MAKIHVLEKHVAELIAAGEVVERPSSVIKELVENSIDAGATTISAEIQRGGIAYMRVTDNGGGIAREDVQAFLRNATSKVESAEDLDGIGTLGFRGEALASICAVSRVTLLTEQRRSWRAPAIRSRAARSLPWRMRAAQRAAQSWFGICFITRPPE